MTTTAPRAAVPLADDIAIARRLLDHLAAGTTDEGDAWREPVSNYRDPARFADELALLRSSSTVFVPSAAVAEPGDHVDRTTHGVPLFAVRDRGGRARVFRNACRHRGVALVDGAGCAPSLVCPYHGWTYRLDGSLSHVPHADGFPDLDLAERGLVEVASEERGGLIVIDALAPVATPDAAWSDLSSRSSNGGAAEPTDDAPWGGALAPSLRPIGVSSAIRPMNWKVLVEQFLEGYHIRTTHRTTFFPLQYDNLNVVETFGPNSRVTYPYRNIERLRERPESTWDTGHRLTYVYHLFPNAIIATFPEMVVVAIIDPVDIDHTMFTTFTLAETATDRDAADDTTEDSSDDSTDDSSADSSAGAPDAAGALRGRALVEAGGLEDNAMSLAVQRGMHAGANEYVEFGRHESAIGHFHRTLTDRLDRLDRLDRPRA